jgi:Tfp pilus assembly protein PilN
MERYGRAVEVKNITINSKPANIDALKALLDTLHSSSVATRASRGTIRAQDNAPPAPEVRHSCAFYSWHCEFH